MNLGPVEFTLVEFPGNQFNGDVAPALVEAVGAGLVRIIDLVFITKDADGNALALELDQVDPAVAEVFGQLDGEYGGLVGEEELMEMAEDVAPDSSALLLVWEAVWARRLAAAVHDSGGRVIAYERIPADVATEALEALTG